MKLLVCFFLYPLVSVLHAQNSIGIPQIVNYNKQDYAAASQNWNIAQDENGLLYFANNAGLLSFDGVFWRTYFLPNRTIVRSVLAHEGRIYVGGQREIGYFSPGKDGDLQYTSLNSLIPEGGDDFADVWNIARYDGHVFFRANDKILEWDGARNIRVHESNNWGYLGEVNGQLLANEVGLGLVYFNKGQWVPRIKQGRLPATNFLLRTALPLGKDSVLLVSLLHGLYLLTGDTVRPYLTPDLARIAPKSIAAACLMPDNRLALATNLGGCFIVDRQGNLVQSFTRQEGIQNNNVLSAFSDRDGNLWLGLDNGIDLLASSNSIRSIYPDRQDRNSGYTSAIFDGKLYLGVSTGVYCIDLDHKRSDISYTTGSFDFVQNTEGQVWNLSVVNQLLMLGHNKGAFVIADRNARPLDTRTGFWSFQSLYPERQSPVLVAGTYSGISVINYRNGQLASPIIYDQAESARFIAIDGRTLWLAHPYKGVFKVQFDADTVQSITRYADRKHILSSNHNKVFRLRDRVLLTTDNGMFEYNRDSADFVRSQELEAAIGSEPVSFIMEDQYNNIWFCRDRQVAVLDRMSRGQRIISIPEIDNRIMAGGFENILVIDSNNVLIAGERGFFHINYADYRNKRLPLQTLIRKVQSTRGEAPLLFGGYRSNQRKPALGYSLNSLHFEFSSTLYGQISNTEYSYYLEGFDSDWSAWSLRTERDYTNLPAGDYVFRVRCRNNTYNISDEARYEFRILPPWYQTWWAYIIWGLLLFTILYLFYKRQQRKYKKQQQARLQEQHRKYEEEQRQLQLQHQLDMQERETQIIQLRNEKLQSEIGHKNSELASAAMNLVQKKEMLSKIKGDLEQYREQREPEKAQKEFLKILRLIDRELDHNEEWEQFAVHFDSVHANYLKKLKEQFPALTTSDLKLAAYLRLNLSSKEIAQLLNISLRGVETSRYRLRKKLDIPADASLFDFLLQVTGDAGESSTGAQETGST